MSTGSATRSGWTSRSWSSSGAYLGRLVQGDFGHSYIQNRAVLGLVLERFPATLQLALAGLFVALVIGLPLGVFAATHKGTSSDRASTIFTLDPRLGAVVPGRLPAAPLPRVPAAGPRHVEIFPIGGYKPFDLRYLALPAITLGFGGGGVLHAAHPDGDDRRAAPGLRPDGAGQGHPRTARSCGATRSATRSAGPQPGRARPRLLPRRRRGRRADLLVAGDRQAGGRFDRDRGRAADPRHGAVRDAVRRARQPGRRHHPGRDRPAESRADDVLDRRARPGDRRPRGRRPVEVPRGRRRRAVGAGRRRGGRDPGVRQRRATGPTGWPCWPAARPPTRRSRGWSPPTSCATSARSASSTPRAAPRPTPAGIASPGPAAGPAPGSRRRATSSPGRRGRRPRRHVPRRRPAVPRAPRGVPRRRRRGRRRPARPRVGGAARRPRRAAATAAATTAGSTCGSTTTTTRSASWAGCSICSACTSIGPPRRPGRRSTRRRPARSGRVLESLGGGPGGSFGAVYAPMSGEAAAEAASQRPSVGEPRAAAANWDGPGSGRSTTGWRSRTWRSGRRPRLDRSARARDPARGAPADSRLAPMERLSRVVGPIATNVHVLADPRTREAIAIDTAMPSLAWIADELAARDWTLKLIVSTHGHWDHIGDNAAVAAHTGAEIAVHPLDRERLTDPQPRLRAVRDPAVGPGGRAGRGRRRPVRRDPPARAPHAGSHRGLGLPASPRTRGCCSAATPCSPAAGGGSTCPAATRTRWSRRSPA